MHSAKNVKNSKLGDNKWISHMIQTGWGKISSTKSFALRCRTPRPPDLDANSTQTFTNLHKIALVHDFTESFPDRKIPRASNKITVVKPPIRKDATVTLLFCKHLIGAWNHGPSLLHICFCTSICIEKKRNLQKFHESEWPIVQSKTCATVEPDLFSTEWTGGKIKLDFLSTCWYVCQFV